MSENLHRIVFRRNLCVVAEVPRQRRQELLQVTKGSCFTVRLVAYQKGQRETADIYFENGTVARDVSCAFFAFVEDEAA